MLIVIDKSFLRASTSARIETLCREYEVIFSETILFELQDSKDRDQCLAKFPSTENSVIFMPDIGNLISYENTNSRAAAPIVKHRIPGNIAFNEKLKSKQFDFSRYENTLAQWRRELKKTIDDLVEVATCIDVFWPKMRDEKGNIIHPYVDDLKKKISKNPNIVRAFYKLIRKSSFVTADKIDMDWAIFRWVQIRVIYCLDWAKRHNFNVKAANRNKIEHDLHDLNYLIIASLCDGMATTDQRLGCFLRLIRPDSTIISETAARGSQLEARTPPGPGSGTA